MAVSRCVPFIWKFIILLLIPGLASAQTLAHRYSFYAQPNGSTTATDLVASANGTIKGNAAITGGQLVLSGASGSYLNLPANLITGNSAISIEAWADYGSLIANCYLFSFGNTDSGGNGEDYIFCAPQAARITISGVDPGYHAEQNASCSGWSGRTGFHIVAVFNPPAGYMALYTNGVLASVNNSITNLLSAVNNVDSYIGKSLYTSDPYAPIKVNEFRIWKGPLSGLQAAADYFAGQTVTNANPGTVTNLQLTVPAQMTLGGKQLASVIGKAANIPYNVDITRIAAYLSGNTNVVTVDTNGLLVAVGPGSTTISASYGTVSATQSISVAIPVALLTHRYSFYNEANGSTSATDVVGSANGTLQGTAAIASGQLVLDGTTGAYVNLPAGIINTNYTGVTIETWASFPASLPVSFIYGFGNTDSGGSGEDYIFSTAQLGRAAITGADPGYPAEQGLSTGGWAGQTNLNIVTVFEPTVGYVSIYTNGVLAGINNSVTTPISAVNDVFSYIGRSLYTGDSYLPGSLSEFRIYNGPLSAAQIALDAATGPTQIITNPGALVSVQLNVSNQMAAGGTQPALFTGNFANVSNVNLFTYTSPTITTDNSNVLSVSSSGVISAIVPGATANVIASYGGLSATQSVTVTGFATNQFAFDNFNDGYWTIINQGNGNALVANTSSSTQEPFTNGATEQQFQVLYNLQNATFRIRQRSSWNFIAPVANLAVSGAKISRTANYTGVSAQQWYLVNAGGGYYRIFNAASNVVLQTDNGSPASVTLAAPSTSPYQLWQFNYQAHYFKKGTAGYEGPPYSTELGTSWAYNYDDNTGATLPAQFAYIPMIDTKYWEPISDLQSRDPGWLVSPQQVYLLGFNEPDNTGSASTNPSTNDAINMWPALMNLNIPLVSPATQNTQDAWENSFFAMIAANNYRVDYTAVHEYVPPNAGSLISTLKNVYNAYGHPVWLTEFSPVDWNNTQAWSENDDYNFLAEFMWQAEGQDWFRRYSIFPFTGTNSASPWVDNGFRGNFFTTGSTLSPYGELYATWDGDLTLHPQIPYLIHNLATSFRLASSNSISAPGAATIYVRNATTEWALVTAANTNNVYIISLNDGRRLRDIGGVMSLAPIGTVGSAVEWNLTGPDTSGYYTIANPAGGHNLNGGGTAPAITFTTVSSGTLNNNTRWRFVKPYQPVTIKTVLPIPSILFAHPGDSSVSLGWNGGGAPAYNVYRGTSHGGPYSQIASALTTTSFVDNGLTNGVPYYYVVTGMNILGTESAYSAEFSAQPLSAVAPQLDFDTTVANGGVQFNWPEDHTGWILQYQTNSAAAGLGSNWIAWPGSTATNQLVIPLDLSQGSVFFRLVHP